MFILTLFFRIVIIVVLFIPYLCFSQMNNQNVEYENTYDGGTLFLKNRDRINFEYISFTDNFAVFQKENSMLLDTMDYSNINFIRVQDGNHAIEGFLLGSLMGVLYVLQASRNPSTNISSDTYLIGASIGGGVGLLVGYLLKNSSTIYRRGKFKIDLTPKIAYIYNSNSYNFLTINIQF